MSTRPIVSTAEETNFVFVGGPSLTGRGNGIRSKVVQAGMREKRRQRRNNAVAEINKLLEDRTTTCTCRQIPIHLARVQKHNHHEQVIKPGVRAIEKHQVSSACCSYCGRFIHSYGAQPPNCSLYNIGSGLDPTIPINETTSRLRVHEIFSYACRHLLPNLRGSTDLPGLYQTWASPFDNDDLKLYTFLWVSKRHEDVMRLTCNMPPDTTSLKEQLMLKGLTLRALRKEVASYRGDKTLDNIIRCMVVLAVNDTETATQPLLRESSPFKPSLTGLHALELFDARVYNRLHWDNMYKLLNSHGGIQVLRPFALAWQVSVADLTNAAHTLRKPLYPMIDVHGKELELDSPLILFAPDTYEFARQPGSGFNELLLLEFPVHQRLVEVFSHVGELSYVMDIIATQSHTSPKHLELLADSRDLVHHRLFSAPDENDAPAQILRVNSQSSSHAQSLQIYLTCRLAVLVYAAHVTFPIPRSSVVRCMLLHSLCPKLQMLADQGLFSPLFLWCTSVALIAADEVEPFAKLLGELFQNVSRNLQIMSLPSIINLLHVFAWSDAATQHHYPRMEGYLSQVNHEVNQI